MATTTTVLPPPCLPGSKVAIIAPAGPVRDKALLESGLQTLRGLGLHPVCTCRI